MMSSRRENFTTLRVLGDATQLQYGAANLRNILPHIEIDDMMELRNKLSIYIHMKWTRGWSTNRALINDSIEMHAEKQLIGLLSFRAFKVDVIDQVE